MISIITQIARFMGPTSGPLGSYRPQMGPMLAPWYLLSGYLITSKHTKPLRWRHNGWCDSVSNHQPHDCLLSRLFRRRSKKSSKLRVTGLCAGNSLGTGEFPAQMASNAENVSIWWRHHNKTHYVRIEHAITVIIAYHMNTLLSTMIFGLNS